MTASTGVVPGRIFMSYRREDTAYPAGWLFDRLARHFGRDQVFKDVDSIELGDDFVEVITTAVGSCEVLLALIGSRWLTVADRNGQRRLDDPHDFVRLEIEAAFTRNVRVIPVLVEGARMPRADELPASLTKLARRQAVELSPARFDFDTRQLFRVLDRIIAEPQEKARQEPEYVERNREKVEEPQEQIREQAAVQDWDGIRDIAVVVIDAFAAAGRPLHMTEQAGLLEPEPVWVCADVAPTAGELTRFAERLPFGRVGYFIHLGELRRDAEIALDQMRLGGKTIITLSLRALRAALADGRVGFFLTELERDYGTKDNLFDTKNALIDERFLFGRDMMLNTIGSAVKRDEHVLITGLRKAGKTSLLNVLRQHLVDQPVCMVDLQRFDRHGEEWPLPFFHLMLAAFDRWGAAERPEWPFRPESPTTTTELEQNFRRRLDHLGTAGAEMRMIVILDEIERVFPGPGEPEPSRRWIQAIGALRALSQGERRYVVVIGADLRPIANRENVLGRVGTNPFFNLFQEMPVALLDDKALTNMVESLARAMGVDTVTTSFTDRLFELTGGHPSLARSIAGEAYRQRQHPYSLTDADLSAGLDQLEDAGTIAFFLRNNLWQLMTSAEREVVVHLAQGRRPPRLGLRNRLGRRPMQEEAHATLRSQGIVNDNGVRIGLFEQWVRDHAEGG